MNCASGFCSGVAAAVLIVAVRRATSIRCKSQRDSSKLRLIKPSKPGATVKDARISFPTARFEALNVTLYDLLTSMAGLSGKVQGGPNWAESDRYDIVAKTGGEIESGQRWPMVMALLAGRFKLAVHHEAKEESGLALKVRKKRPQDLPIAKGQ